jgi:hypothetical protein
VDGQLSGLARAVGADHRPPYTRSDRQVERSEDRPAGATDNEVVDLDDGLAGRR